MATAHELRTAQPEDAGPRRLAGRQGKGRGSRRRAVDAVRARPLAATGVIAALAMFLAREPLMDWPASWSAASAKSARPARAAKTKQAQTEKK